MNYSQFQFRGFKIERSLIERNSNTPSKQIYINFKLSGIINTEKTNFQLKLDVKIKDKNKSFNIEIDAVANFSFEKNIELSNLDNYFYVNAPAILFPYIRAYISALTTLSGFEAINLPTLNVTKIEKDLKENTKQI